MPISLMKRSFKEKGGLHPEENKPTRSIARKRFPMILVCFRTHIEAILKVQQARSYADCLATSAILSLMASPFRLAYLTRRNQNP